MTGHRWFSLVSSQSKLYEPRSACPVQSLNREHALSDLGRNQGGPESRTQASLREGGRSLPPRDVLRRVCGWAQLNSDTTRAESRKGPVTGSDKTSSSTKDDDHKGPAHARARHSQGGNSAIGLDMIGNHRETASVGEHSAHVIGRRVQVQWWRAWARGKIGQGSAEKEQRSLPASR